MSYLLVFIKFFAFIAAWVLGFFFIAFGLSFIEEKAQGDMFLETMWVIAVIAAACTVTWWCVFG